MPLQPWAELVTRGVRGRLLDVRAVRSGAAITWMRGAAVARLEATGPGRSELTVATARSVACRTYPERMDVNTAYVAAANIVGHFEPARCRGLDVAPFSAGEMARFAGQPGLRPQQRRLREVTSRESRFCRSVQRERCYHVSSSRRRARSRASAA